MARVTPERGPLRVRDRDDAATVDPTAPPPDDGERLPIVIGAVQRTDGGSVRVEVVAGGWRFELDVEPVRRAALRERATRAASAAGPGGAMGVHAMIPGRVVAIAVAAGDAVTVGTQLLVVEAMKMQNDVPSPADAVVARVNVSPGDTVELGDLLVVLAAPGAVGGDR
jgi:glutaconyl-CoA/methylmalonyl-CoA decarboxylase subunit gamma